MITAITEIFLQMCYAFTIVLVLRTVLITAKNLIKG